MKAPKLTGAVDRDVFREAVAGFVSVWSSDFVEVIDARLDGEDDYKFTWNATMITLPRCYWSASEQGVNWDLLQAVQTWIFCYAQRYSAVATGLPYEQVINILFQSINVFRSNTVKNETS